MNILVINTGSSSIKYEVFERASMTRRLSGMVERIGEDCGRIQQKKYTADGLVIEFSAEHEMADHNQALKQVSQRLMDAQYGVLSGADELSAVGHRIVHGGERFTDPMLVDDDVLQAIKDNIPLAPLHNPVNLLGIEIMRELFPSVPQVAVFDTAFHQSIPPHAFLYALPIELYERDRVRRYGFHGTSHQYVAEQAAKRLGKALHECKLITIHLGNGASMAAVKHGRCVDTTMGMTPLEGLVMGTRCGDIDPALPFYLSNHLNMSLDDMDDVFNKASGLKGLCGENDMREVIRRCEDGDQAARRAVDVYTYRIKKYIGSYLAVLGRLDALVFTAGIGEHSPKIRELSVNGLEHLGVTIDLQRNLSPKEFDGEINQSDSRVKTLVVPTNEELKIAQETQKVISAL